MFNKFNNEKFDVVAFSAALDKLLSDVWDKSSQHGLSLSVEDFKNIDMLRSLYQERVSDTFEVIEYAGQVRKRHLLNDGSLSVSIGEDCFCRTILTRWGLKKSAKMGEKSQPFDLSIHSFKVICHLLKNNFADYLNPLDMIYDKSVNFCKNSKLNIYFNHETGVEYSVDDFIMLREKYSKRIVNFFDSVALNDNVNFYLHIRSPKDFRRGEVNELADILAKLRGEKKWNLICILTWPAQDLIPEYLGDNINPSNVYFIDVNYPFDGYIWYNPNHASSRAGFLFEKDLINKIELIIGAKDD